MPISYMIGNDHGGMVIVLCSGTAPATMSMDMPRMNGDMTDHGTPKEQGKAEMPCAFSGLSAATSGPVDPIQRRR